jgi:separase
MLALAGKLLAHGLESQAIKELRITKGRLEAVGKAKSGPSEKETLASLLHIKIDADNCPAVLPLAITYQSLVLRVIAVSSKSATIEASADFLELSEPMSPANLIKLHSDQSGDKEKAGRLLESLSSTILGLCPSLSSKGDQIAVTREISPAPEAVIRLQSIGLQIRTQWWELVKHQPDLEKELLDPASRCISAFIRRTRKRQNVQQTYSAANQFVQNVISNFESNNSKALLAIHRTLTSLAEEAGQNEQAQKWSAVLNKQSESLEPNHAQRVSALVRRVLTLDVKAASSILLELIGSLKATISGSASDYECLLADLSHLLTRLPAGTWNDADLQLLGSLSAAFALRFVRSYPGKGLSAAQSIIYQALRYSASTDVATSWINHEAIQVLVDTGALQTVVQVATSRPFNEAWSSSTAAIALGRALRLLFMRNLKSSSSSKPNIVFDNETLAHLERGLMLEWQLSVALEHAAKAKYHAALRTMIPQLLQKLDLVYSSSQHPLRRAHLAIQVLQLNEIANVVTREALQQWLDTEFDTTALLQDQGLGSYADDVRLALRLAKIFHAGNPSICNLRPILSAWQQLLDEATSPSVLKDCVFEPASLRLSLRSLACFFGALGEETHQLSTIAIIAKLDALEEGNVAEQVDTSTQNARQWLSLGCSEKAGTIFAHSEKHLSSSDVSVLTKISWHLAYAEYLLAIDNLDKCRCSLETAGALRKELSPKEISKDQRATFERAHGEGWLLQSKYNLASGAPHDALAAAKHAMKIVNSAWCRLEKIGSDTAPRPEEDTTTTTIETSEGAIVELTNGVSKLQLFPKATSILKEMQTPDIKGAAFWPLTRLLCRTLMHLCDLYARHGLFSEANYYSGKAIEIAESMGSSVLLSRTRSHRALLLALAGKTEDAELCLVGSEGTDLSSSPFAALERLQAQAALRAKDGDLEEAAKLYDQAGQLVVDMQSEEWMSKINRFDDHRSGKGVVAKAAQKATAVKSVRTTTRARKAPVKSVPVVPKSSARSVKVTCVDETFYVLQKLRTGILLQRTLLGLSNRDDNDKILLALAPLQSTISGTLKQRQVQYRGLLEKATAILQYDFAYNILFDSTLSIPALLRPAVTVETTRSASPTKKAASTKTSTRGQRKTAAKPDFKSILHEARGCLLAGYSSVPKHCTSAEVYIEGSNLLDTSVFCASVDPAATAAGLHSVQTGLTLDFPRINALQLEQSAALADANHELKTTPFEWPTMPTTQHDPQLNATDFQQNYINTIPKSWTAVSLALDNSCTSLYVARYRANQTPFIVRLPFSRHQDEQLGDQAFDYAAGKEELQDIIQHSNISCHNNADLSAKGAKNKWWSEREALDRRLQELLINMEDMWFGGFKGVFSPRARRPELLARFRAAFEASLDRHLPSRQAVKGRESEKLALDHNVLELFVNLGSDNDGTVDLDESISDLLYFVVDMLQFNRERNAYDEIDFDEMTVEVLDALRAYNEAIEAERDERQHVILVLDKRLQAFPWENLPCLERTSVSRVGSMLSLRDCIAAMRTKAEGDEGCHKVSRTSGAFILNPSSDLVSTQSTLQPALSQAAAVDGAEWRSIVNRAPSEEDFKSTLQNSAMTLYFGHGAGSQYIRPRTIKKLEKCSEVVWLMGCSSGAVTEYGELEPQAVPLAYLNAGMRKPSSSSAEQGSKCLSIVATLWDVTDKDIDRFSLTIGEKWGLWPSASEPARIPAKTPKKRDRLVAPSTPQKALKTPKTPRVVKTPAATKTPTRNQSRSKAGERSVAMSLAGAVARSRDACYLRYLNGAAPVVFGVPVYLGD